MSLLLASCSERPFLTQSLLPYSARFGVSGLMVRSVICLELSFVQGGSIFIRLHVAIHTDQHHLSKMLSLLQRVFFLLIKFSCQPVTAAATLL